MNTFNIREKRFKTLFKEEHLVTPLLAVIPVERSLYDNLKRSSIIYLSKVLGIKELPNDKEITDICTSRSNEFTNITPTGMILPKAKTSIEYNLLLRDYYLLIRSMYFADKFIECHTPAHIRVKWEEAQESNLNRPRHAPEEPHFDSWSGYSSQGITLILGLFGDIERNTIKFYTPRGRIDESWLIQGTKINSDKLLDNYDAIKYSAPEGSIIAMDTALLHQTSRKEGCGTRFSIDNIFLTEKMMNIPEHIEKYRKDELTKVDDLYELGSKNYYYCYHEDEERKDTKGGAIDPTACQYISIKSFT